MRIRHAKDDEPLLNGRQLAKSIGRGVTYVTAAKAAGYRFQYGTMTTRRHFLEWLSENPHFRVTGYVKEHSRKKKPERERRSMVCWLQSLGGPSQSYGRFSSEPVERSAH